MSHRFGLNSSPPRPDSAALPIRTSSIILFTVAVTKAAVYFIDFSSLSVFYIYSWILVVLGITTYFVLSSIGILFDDVWRSPVIYNQKINSWATAFKTEFGIGDNSKNASGLRAVPVPQPLKQPIMRSAKYGVISVGAYILAIVVVGFLASIGVLSTISSSLSIQATNRIFSELSSQLFAVGLAGSVIPLSGMSSENQFVVLLLIGLPLPLILMCARSCIRVLDEFHLRVFRLMALEFGTKLGYYSWLSLFVLGYFMGAIYII